VTVEVQTNRMRVWPRRCLCWFWAPRHRWSRPSVHGLSPRALPRNGTRRAHDDAALRTTASQLSPSANAVVGDALVTRRARVALRDEEAASLGSPEPLLFH